MNVCLIGDGLISLTLAKTLINNKIKVFVYSKNNKKIINNKELWKKWQLMVFAPH